MYTYLRADLEWRFESVERRDLVDLSRAGFAGPSGHGVQISIPRIPDIGNDRDVLAICFDDANDFIQVRTVLAESHLILRYPPSRFNPAAATGLFGSSLRASRYWVMASARWPFFS